MLALFAAAALAAAPVPDAARGRALSAHAIVLTNDLHVTDAEREAREALAIADDCQDPVGRARALDALGIVERLRGHEDAALDFTQEALAIAESHDDSDTIARAENDLGRIAFDLQANFGAAREWYERGLERAPRIADRSIVARLVNNLGNLTRAENDFAGAIRYYERAASESKRANDRYGMLTAEHNIGLVYSQQNSPTPALVHLQRALAIERALRNRSAIARTLLSISETHRALGDSESALADLRGARDAAERSGDQLTLATILLRDSELRLDRNDLAGARRSIDRSIDLLQKLGDTTSLPQALTYRARLRLAQGRAREAGRIAASAADDAQRLGQISVRAEAETIAGQAYLAAGRTSDARRALRAAVEAVERERGFVVGGEEAQQRSFEGQVLPYRLLMSISSPREALALAERAKARVLFDVLRGTRTDVRSMMNIPEQARDRALREALIRAERSGDAAAIRRTRDEYAAFNADLYAAHPEMRLRAGQPPPIALGRLPSLLPRENDAIIEYAITGSKLLIMVITRDGLHSYSRTIAREQLRLITNRFARELGQRNLGFRKTSRELYDLLIAPAEETLRGRGRICIVPDEELWRVPFQALLAADDRYLLERSAIFYAPSIAVLQEMMRGSGPLTFDSLLAVGNTSIPETGSEVSALRDIYRGGDVTVLRSAREERVKALMPRYGVVHFATHGVFDDSSPLDSHLEFERSADDDGHFDAREMLAMRLRAALVVLSACQTGAGRPAAGEGIIGMSWALFVAGCPAMAASEWKVESVSTTVLMIRFHQNLVVKKLTVAEALREAQLALLQNSRYEHPFYWASFVALGRGW